MSTLECGGSGDGTTLLKGRIDIEGHCVADRGAGERIMGEIGIGVDDKRCVL